MKVLVCLSYYTPYVSGLSEYAKRLVQTVGGPNLDIEIVCVKHNDLLLSKEAVSGKLVRRFEPTVKINKLQFSFPLVWWSIRNMGRYDLTIINLPFPEGVFVSIINKLYRKRLISIYHCEVDWGSSTVRRVLSFFARLSNLFCSLLSERIVINTLDYSKQISMFNFFAKKTIEVFPIIGIKGNKLPLELKKHKKLRIGFLGRVSEEKNLETLISAIKMFGDGEVELIMAGPVLVVGEDSYFKKIQSLIEPIKNRVVLAGELRKTELRSFFSKIDFLVLPSNRSTESFGIVQVEAMLHGVPVIVSNLPGIRIPVLKTGAGVLVDRYNDADGWFEAFRLARRNQSQLTKKTLRAKFFFNSQTEKIKWKRLIYEIQD